MRKRPAILWATEVQVKPVMQPRTAEASSVPDDLLPELQFELPPFPGQLTTDRKSVV